VHGFDTKYVRETYQRTQTTIERFAKVVHLTKYVSSRAVSQMKDVPEAERDYRWRWGSTQWRQLTFFHEEH